MMARITHYTAGAVLALGLAWHTFTVQRADHDEVRRASLEALRSLVADVDNKAMSASFGLLPAYDDLVHALEALRKHTRAVVVVAKGTADENAFLLVLDRVEMRTRQIDELKEQRSMLTNSERLLREKLGALRSPAVDALRAELLSQRLVPGEARSLDALQKLRADLAADVDGAALVRHLDVVLDAERRLNNLTKQLLERGPDSLSALVDARATEQLAQLEAHRKQANTGRLLSLSLALLLIVAALWLPERR